MQSSQTHPQDYEQPSVHEYTYLYHFSKDKNLNKEVKKQSWTKRHISSLLTSLKRDGFISVFVSFAEHLSGAGSRRGERGARCGGIEHPEESQSPRSREAFQRVYEFSPFNEIPRKWIVTKYFRRSFIIDRPILIPLRVDRGHAYLRARSRRTAVCPHTCMYLLVRSTSSVHRILPVHPSRGPARTRLPPASSPIVSCAFSRDRAGIRRR